MFGRRLDIPHNSPGTAAPDNLSWSTSPVSTASLASPPSTRAGWFADRPLAVKFGLLIAAVVVALGGLLGSELLGGKRVHEAELELAGLEKARR